MTDLTIGQHRGQRAGDVIEVEVHGAFTLSDVTQLLAVAQATLRQHQRCFLIADVHALTGIDAEARRMMATWGKTETERLSGTAIYGCSFAMRTIITLTLNAIEYFGKTPLEAVFVRDRAEARSWIDGKRAALVKGVNHGE
jgi:hypothetical protein